MKHSYTIRTKRNTSMDEFQVDLHADNQRKVLSFGINRFVNISIKNKKIISITLKYLHQNYFIDHPKYKSG